MRLNFRKKEKIEKKYVKRIKTIPEKGLTSQQVIKLKAAGYSNVCHNQSYKTIRQIIFDNIFTFFNLMFFILGVCLFFANSHKDMFFLIIVILNTLIGIFQQIRSKIKLDKLTVISSPKSIVIRDGKKISVRNSELVRDDIIILRSGDQITADCTLLKGDIQVDESLLTGESDPISKKIGQKLLSGSFVLSGECFARLDNIGEDSYASKLVAEAKKQVKKPQSDMMASLDKLIRVIGFTIIPIGLVLFFKQTFILNMNYQDSVTTTVSALVGMIPEGLYLLTSIALAISVINLLESKTLVHDMGSIETLARVNVLCVDKTGTITEPNMKVTNIVPLFNNSKNDMYEIINEIVFNMQADNATSKALKEHFNKSKKWEINQFYPFLSSTKWSAANFKDYGTYVIGAPEFILNEKYKSIESTVNEYISQGTRVLLVSKLDGSIEKNNLIGNVTPLCLILIENPIRKEAPKTFQFFKEQGVQIKVISGDNPIAVSRIAQRAKIENADKYIDASTLKTEQDIKHALKKYTVFGRVTPDQKRTFVKILKENKKNTVAMTGDGVNDVLALKNADVGVAMASGSDAACQASELVLLNSDFSSMPKVVMEGRRVINNIERSASLFLVKNIFSFIFSIIALFANVPYPITPFQWTLISTLTIGIPSFFLTIEPTTSIVKGRFIVNVLKKALPGGLCNVLIIIVLQICSAIFCFDLKELSTTATVLLATNGLLVLFEVCKPLSWKRLTIFLSMVISMVFAIFMLPNFFSLVPISATVLIVLIILIILNYPLLRLLQISTSNLLKN